MLPQFFIQFLFFQCHQAFECTWHQICTGDTAKQPIGMCSKLQRIENIKQIFFQRIVLIDKGKSDQHITVQNASIIITLTASSIPGYGTDRKRRTVTAILFFFVDIDYTIFHTVIAAVIKIKI